MTSLVRGRTLKAEYRSCGGGVVSSRNAAWSREEVEAIVADYFQMLSLELTGQAYSKAQHRRALAKVLNNRSDGSIERKHQNISAVMINAGCFYIAGYKPLPNVQGLLTTVVEERLFGDSRFHRIAEEAAERSAVSPSVDGFEGRLVDAPEPVPPGNDLDGRDGPSRYANHPPLFRDYLAMEARNRDLGLAGEEFVLAYEAFRLHQAGFAKLANRIEHVAKTKGDGLGYDILSYDPDGQERLIEVKTTSSGKLAPFFVTANELTVSRETAQQYHLYRVFEFRQHPRLFDLPGSVDSYCRLYPSNYLARFN